jgi:hypothetical protein
MPDIKIEWKGQKLVILESDTFELGEAIEEVVSLTQLSSMGKSPQFHKLARCFAIMINFAGGTTTPSEVHKEMMKEIKTGGAEAKGLLALVAVETLITILMDGAPEVGEGADEGKTVSGSSKAVSA